MTTEIASPPVAGVASTEKIAFGSGEVNSADRFVAVVEIGLSLVAAEALSKVVMEGMVIVVECDVTERLGVMDSAEETMRVVGGSVGVAVLVRVDGMLVVGNSVVVALASGIQGLMLSSVLFVGVVANVVELTESVHISVSEGATVIEGEIIKSVESGTELEIVGTEGVVGAAGAGAAGVAGAALGLSLVGVFVSPSCIWANSFSGVLRPDVVGGGPGLRTGFGSKAGFPADSCADTLGRI